MKNDDLDALDSALTAVGDRLAADRRWDDLAPSVRRTLRRPFRDLALLLGGAGVLVLLGLREDDVAAGGASALRTFGPAVALLAFALPGMLGDALARRRALADRDGALFAACARELREQRTRHLVFLVLVVPLLIALLVFALGAPDPWGLTGPLALAALLVLYTPYLVLVRLPATNRALRALEERSGEPASVRATSEHEDPDEDDESGLSIALGLLASASLVFLMYLGPLVLIALGVAAARADDPTRTLVVAGVLAVACAVAWIVVLVGDRDGEDRG